MEVTSTPPILPPQRTTTAVGDRDVGQKGTFYRRRGRRPVPPHPPEPSQRFELEGEEPRRSIDIRV